MFCREDGASFTVLEDAPVSCTSEGLAVRGRPIAGRDDFLVRPGIDERFAVEQGCALAGPPSRPGPFLWLAGLALLSRWTRGRSRRASS